MAEAARRKAYQELEQKITERTAYLVATNKTLLGKIEKKGKMPLIGHSDEMQKVEPFFWMKLNQCRYSYRLSFYVYCRIVESYGWAATVPYRLIAELWRQAK